jgi:hypothetical protein
MTKSSVKRKQPAMTDHQWREYINKWIARSIHLKKLNEELEEDKCKQNSVHRVEEKDPKKGSS